MADEYRTVAGFVQFEPNVRDHNGKQLQDVLIQNISGNMDIRVTIWPEAGLTAKRGDFVVAAGKYTEREQGGRTYRNISGKNVLVFPGNLQAPGTVVNPLPSDGTTTQEPAPF